ncbi:hypothetical protein Nmel_001299 [Mimus melanotis]
MFSCCRPILPNPDMADLQIPPGTTRPSMHRSGRTACWEHGRRAGWSRGGPEAAHDPGGSARRQLGRHRGPASGAEGAAPTGEGRPRERDPPRAARDTPRAGRPVGRGAGSPRSRPREGQWASPRAWRGVGGAERGRRGRSGAGGRRGARGAAPGRGSPTEVVGKDAFLSQNALFGMPAPPEKGLPGAMLGLSIALKLLPRSYCKICS